jgi:excisionase family DNA binding protein
VAGGGKDVSAQRKPEVVAEEGSEGLIEDGFVNVAGASAFLVVSRSKVYELMEAGELAYAKFGRTRRIPRRALREYARRCLVSQ